MTQNQDQSIHQSGLFPLATPDQVKDAYKQYHELCDALLVPYDERIVDTNGVIRQESDYARITQPRKNKAKWITEYQDAPRKSAFRKLARFYGVSTEIIDKEKTTNQETVTWHYTVRAWQNNVSTMGIGACSTDEKKDMSEHDAKATAHTRAKNRAISDLIGFGQVSAEEINHHPQDNTQNTNNTQKKTTKAKPKQKPLKTNNKPDPDEKQVLDAFLDQGISKDQLNIKNLDNTVWVQHPLGISQEKWSQYQKALSTADLTADYHKDKNAWEITRVISRKKEPKQQTKQDPKKQTNPNKKQRRHPSDIQDNNLL